MSFKRFRLQRLQRLQRVQRLQRLQRLPVSAPAWAALYCGPTCSKTRRAWETRDDEKDGEMAMDQYL